MRPLRPLASVDASVDEALCIKGFDNFGRYGRLIPPTFSKVNVVVVSKKIKRYRNQASGPSVRP